MRVAVVGVFGVVDDVLCHFDYYSARVSCLRWKSFRGGNRLREGGTVAKKLIGALRKATVPALTLLYNFRVLIHVEN